MPSPEPRNLENRSNNNIEKLSQHLQTQAKAFSTGLEKALNDLLLADQFPGLANLEFEFTESRRRQTEEIQELIKHATILEKDIERILLKYHQALTREWETKIASQENVGIAIQNFNRIYLEILLTEKQKMERLFNDLQKQIAQLQAQLRQTYQLIGRTITDFFNDLIQSVGNQTFDLGSRKIQLKDVIIYVFDGLLKALANGTLTAENFKEVATHLIQNFSETNLTKTEHEENGTSLAQWAASQMHVNVALNRLEPSLRSATQLQSRINSLETSLQISQLTPENPLSHPTPSAPPPLEAQQKPTPSAPPLEPNSPQSSSRTIIHSAPANSRAVVVPGAAHSDEGQPPDYSNEGQPPAYSNEGQPPPYSDEGQPSAHSDEGQPPAYSNSDEGQPSASSNQGQEAPDDDDISNINLDDLNSLPPPRP